MPPSSPACSTPAAPSSARSHCEYFCFSGGSHTCATGPVHNPHKMGYSAGGSSSGSAVVVATGEADMAIGGDQGGSIRIPAAFSGIYGMKGTHGLVPYTGVMPIEITIDHTGPMTRNVRDNALLLEVLAGADGLDPRQIAPKVANLHRSARWRRQGIAHRRRQGRFWASESPSATSMPRSRRAPSCSASSAPPSTRSRCPMHLLAPAIWLPIAAEGATEFMMKGNGMGTNWRGLYNTTLLDAHSGWKHRADELSDSLKITMLLGQYFTKALSRPLLRQGAKPEPQAAGRLRCGLEQIRSVADADLADEGDTVAAGGRAARALYPARVRNGSQHRAVQRQRASGDEHSLRHERRSADRVDADRQVF